ncbi:hypothetical protein [Nocardia shimofusensis]|uniref:hypothetical protein n=1 Tax=Nocardia shimofusensis TaxID=228596 RepID=UPI00082C3252|nr:hypothetical protein [Nocardia shimofusensis]
MNRPPHPAVFTVPRLLGGLAAAVVLAASIASYSFTAPLARLAGADESLVWLWPVVAGLTVAQIAYTSVVLTRLGHYERVKPLLTFYRLMLFALVLTGLIGSVMAATGMPSELSTAAIIAVVSVPAWCLVFCVVSYLVLSTAEKTIQAERMAASRTTLSQQAPWWEQSGKAARADFSAEGDPARPPSS